MSIAGPQSAHDQDARLTVRLTPEAFAKPPGGVRRTALELLSALRSSGVDVSASGFVDATVTETSATLSPVRRAALQTAEAAFFAGRRLARQDGVAHTLYYDQQLRAAPWPLVVTVHDMIHERFGVGSNALRRAKRLAVRHASLIITPSVASAADVVVLFPGIRAEVVTIPWGLARAFVTETPDPVSEIDGPFLLYVGARAGYKNAALLVRALAGAPDLGELRLVLAGGGRLTDDERRDLADALGHGERALHLPAPTDDVLRNLYDHAAALVVTSRCEGFGLPILEAMARGCPVACAEGGSSGEVAAGNAAMFSPDSEQGCADAIRQAIAVPRAQRDAARLHARRYDWQRTALAHIEAYELLLAARRRRLPSR